MTIQDDAYADYANTGPKNGSDKLAQLATLAEQKRKADTEVAEAEMVLKAAQKRLQDLVERQIPELMEEVGIADFSTPSGLKITVAEKIRASIPADDLQRALVWLRENGHSGLIKHVLTMDFGMGEDDRCSALLKKLMDEGYEPEEKENVHPQTLLSFVKEKLAKGETLPDVISIHRQKEANVELPKPPAPRRK